MLLDEAIAFGWDGPGPVSLDPALEREFEERVADSSTLAFRVALGVLRHREDAEDVAQDAFLRAHRAFGSLRDRRSWRRSRSTTWRRSRGCWTWPRGP